MKYLYYTNSGFSSKIRKVEITKETPKFYFVGETKISKERMCVSHGKWHWTNYYLETDEEMTKKYKEQNIKANYNKKLEVLSKIDDIETITKIWNALKELGL